MIAENYIKSHATSVKDIMTRDVVTAFPDTRLHDIAGGFAESDTARRAIRVAAESIAGVTTVNDHMMVEVTVY